VAIDPTVETGSGLSKLCYVSCKDILTRDQALIRRTVGFLSDSALRQIAGRLKTVLDIP
jgi:mRNA-degrading endonuclease toxin of MazEF toxin-antitoxin module